MFGVVSQFLSQLWNGAPTGGTNSFESRPDSGILSTTEENSESYKLNVDGAKFETEEMKKTFFGKVTKLYDNAGLVDDEVYFTFDKVLGGARPTLNSEVQVKASRVSANDGWRADQIEIMATDWDELGDDGTEEVIIGDITDINEKYFVVGHDTHCPITSLAFGYVPCKGDWVQTEIIRDRGLVCEVKVVKPLREKNLTGNVTSVGHGHGYINTDIFFSFGSCRANYLPRKGHTVRVTAIESNQGNCKWRAVKVDPTMPRKETKASTMPRSGPRMESKFTKKLLENKADIVITNEINFSDVTLGEIQETVIFIRNDGSNSVVLKSVDGLLQDSIFKIDLFGQEVIGDNLKDGTNNSENLQCNIQISPQSLVEFKVTVNSRLLGEFNLLVVFNFGDFQIGRYFTANVKDEQLVLLEAKSPYHRRKYVDKKEALNKVLDARNNQQWVIPGERPMFKQKTINISTKLRQYEIPRTLRQYILNKMDLCFLVPSLAQPLSMRNYEERFSALLHAEEVQMELEMREFDLKQVSLKAAGEFLSLVVPGLAEGRPSLLIGDRVILCVSGASTTNSPKYEGFIHEVLNTEILLKFHEDFHATYDLDFYDVMFFFNRTPLRRCHKAVESAKYLGDQVLFPNEVLPKLPQDLKKDKQGLFKSKLNARQRAAVSRILIGQSRPMPYVLFGPPGTGKTVTLVEAILQILHRISISRIIACTPSNSAADLIAERLHRSGEVSEGDMVRLNAFQRQQNIPEDIENYSTNIAKLDVAAHYRIVICTCTTAGQLHTLGLAPGHFTHVIIDEAGQATEPESLVPISFLAGTEGQVILSGDPYQLGAVLRSPISQAYGLNISLLERLMARTPYLRDGNKFSDHGCYDPLVVTKLVNNYRCHEALLDLPSRLFYHAEMVPCADENVKNCLCGWDALPNKNGFPVLFHGVKGEDLREGNSPSWFNAVEAVQVIRYVQELRKFKERPVKLDDFGIITPYRKQVEKIRLLLDRLGMNKIKVGSVEEFQGQERLVVIISTVRSRENLIGFDYTHNLGFLGNPKRFNVAITRAQALMIVIGNPHVLVKDTNWRALLKYCFDNDSYVGCDLPSFNEHQEEEPYDCGSQAMQLNNDITEQIVAHLGCVDRCFGSNHANTEKFTNGEYKSSPASHNSNASDQSSTNGIPLDSKVEGRVNVGSDASCMTIVDTIDGSKGNTDGIPVDIANLVDLKRKKDDICVEKLSIDGKEGSKRDSGCISMDDRGVQGIYGAKRGSDGNPAEKLDTIDDSGMDCLSTDDFDARKAVVRDNLDMKGHDGLCGVNEGICGFHVDNGSLCIAEVSENVNRPPEMTTDSSKLFSAIDSYPTPTQDNSYESSDEEELEEIVYKPHKGELA